MDWTDGGNSFRFFLPRPKVFCAIGMITVVDSISLLGRHGMCFPFMVWIRELTDALAEIFLDRALTFHGFSGQAKSAPSIFAQCVRRIGAGYLCRGSEPKGSQMRRAACCQFPRNDPGAGDHGLL